MNTAGRIQALSDASHAQAVNRQSEARQLTKLVGVRVDPITYDRWFRAARHRGMSVPEFVRLCTDHMLNIDEAEKARRAPTS